jgi:hypothetical protein
MQVTGDNGRTYELTFRGGEAYLPLHLFNLLVVTGVVDRLDKPDLKPRFERLPDGSNGKPISVFEPFVREIAR